MNSKAIRKQLLAAVAMVLVAAVALGSSTYAWFVASGSVTATGMQVNLTSSGGLVIRYVGAGDTWGVTANANLAKENLLPTSTKDMTVWTYAQAQNTGAYGMDKSTYQNVTSDVLDNTNKVKSNNGYVQMAEFQIRSSNETIAANGLTVKSVTVTKGDGTAASQDISNSLKVGVRWNYTPSSGAAAKTGSLIMSPLNLGTSGQTTSYTFVNPGTAIEGTKYVTLGSEETVTMKVPGTNATILTSDVPVSSSTTYPVTVYIYVWYEGQDAHLYSDNVHSNEDLKISVEFESSFGTGGAGGSGTQQPAEIDLTSATVSSTTVTAKKPNSDETDTYYKISGITEELYTDSDSSTALTNGSKIYTITGEDGNKQATEYTGTVKLPT